MESDILKTKFNHLLLVLFTILHVNVLNASVYDVDVLEIFSKILPRIVMMSSQKEKIKDSVNICVIHDSIDKTSAIILKEKIALNYKNGIKNKQVDVIHSDYSNISLCKGAQLSFMFNTDNESFSQALKFLNHEKIITVSYDPQLLQNGVEVSLFLGRRVIPYINMESVNKNEIKLENILLRVSKIYREGDK